MNKIIKIKDTVKETGLKIGKNTWMASLGVVAIATETAGNSFNNLVEKGTQKANEKEATDSKIKIQDKALELKSAVGNFIQKPVHKVMDQFGIPRSSDMEALNEKIRLLTEKIQHMTPATKNS